MDYGTHRRGIDAQKTVDSEEDRGSEVSQMKIEDQEDQSLKFDFYVIPNKCFFVLRSFFILEGPA